MANNRGVGSTLTEVEIDLDDGVKVDYPELDAAWKAIVGVNGKEVQ